jgi:cytochrome c6
MRVVGNYSEDGRTVVKGRLNLFSGKSFLGLVLVLSFVSVARAQSDAEKIFKAKCVACHAANGSGDTKAGKNLGAQDLRLPAVAQESDSTLVGIISKGKNKMPKFDEKLTQEQIKSLIPYVRSLAKIS